MSLFLITGGAGFIGSHLADALLQAGHGVRVVDDLSTGRRANLDPRAELHVGDVADTALLRAVSAGVAGIFHLAAVASVARSSEDWIGTHRTNLTGTVAVLDTARAQGRIPVVYASSAAIYGDQGPGPVAEGARPAPRTAYGADKLGSELHAAVGAMVHKVPAIGFRFFNVYGPRQDPASPYSGVISIFAARIIAGQCVVIHGDGRQIRDFVYVADVVAHLLAGIATMQQEQAGGRARSEILNVCTGLGTSILTLAETLGGVTGRQPTVDFGPARVGDIRTSLGNPEAAIATLHLRAQTSLKNGLAATCDSLGPIVQPTMHLGKPV